MNVLLVEPGKAPCSVEIDGSLESLQAAVGGDIQAIYPYQDPVALVCHEEGKLIGLPLNRVLRDEDNGIYDIIAGDFLIVGLGEDDFTSLPPDLAEKYAEHFRNPEDFLRIAGKIVVLKQPLPEEKTPPKSHSVPER